MGVDLVHDPVTRLTEVAASFFNSRALRIAAEARIADMLSDADPAEGISIEKISQKVGIRTQNLSEWRIRSTECTEVD